MGVAPGAVLDASALLAYLGDEDGAEKVAQTIARGAVIGAVNLAEALSTLAARGGDAQQITTALTDRGLLHGTISVEPYTVDDAVATGALRPATRAAGLSLGDRACLALAQRLAAPALTADHTWSDLDLGVDVVPIRAAPR